MASRKLEADPSLRKQLDHSQHEKPKELKLHLRDR
jgi:hypothetical protein